MNKKNRITDASECVHCHLCLKHCSFLKKYKIDIGDTERLSELAYHCFLCGKCTQVCPRGIDGREIVLDMRRRKVEENAGKPAEKGYGLVLSEKKRYLFKNYRHADSKSVLFPGCNFPSFYPETTQKLVTLFEEAAGIGVAYDCCGKPVAELGLSGEEEKIIKRIENSLIEHGVTELIMVCPNCYYYLKPRLSVHVVNLYDKLKELGIGKKVAGGSHVFPPCPDRENLKWLESIQRFLETPDKVIEKVQCCGLGGCAAVKEPILAKLLSGGLKEAQYDKIHTYCGSCAGNLARNGCKDVTHVLTEILETQEKPDTAKSMLNRMKTKFL